MRCLKSIPIHPDIQVIVVDDCSPNVSVYLESYPVVYFTKFMDKPIRCFTTLGIHSLELYVLHYFVIIGCSCYSSPWISEVSRLPFFFQLSITLITTCALAAITLTLARVVDNNSTLRKVLLGKL